MSLRRDWGQYVPDLAFRGAVNTLAFGPDGILFIGDTTGAQVVAIDTSDAKSAKDGPARNIDNLMMAGRPISTSYLAFSSTRVLRTGAIVGQAVGVAAAICKKYQATITTKDDRNNTKTFTDYCDASSNSEATTIFKARYPKATVSGVRETK